MRHAALLPAILFLALAPAAQQWVALHPGAAPGERPAVAVRAGGPGETLLEVTVPGFFAEKTTHGWKIRFPGRLRTTEEGRPELPCVGCTLALPLPGRPVLDLVEADFVQPGSFRVRMAPKLELDSQRHTPPPPRAPHRPYPEGIGEVTHQGHWRQVPAASLRLHPCRAAGDGTRLQVARRFTVKVTHPGAPAGWPRLPLTRRSRALLADTFLNGDRVPATPHALDGPATEYLVLTTAAHKAAVQPLVDWRREAGWRTEVVTLTTASPAAIKGVIQQRFAQGRLEHVLFVGDYAQIPYGTFHGNRSDSWYVCLTGGASPDLYPDAGLGRLSGTTAAEITHQVQKILAYETKPAAGSWHDRIVLTAHRESGATGRFTSCAEQIAKGPLQTSGWTTIKQYGYQSGVSNSTLTNHINQGAGIVFYRGHGGTTSWSGWCSSSPSSFTVSNVAGLKNGGATPVVFSICCTTGYFKHPVCYTEQWLRAQYGGIACLGATNVSYTSGNTPMAIEFCRAIFGDRTTNIYGFHLKGITKALQVGGTGGKKAAYLFCWMGDSATDLWLRKPVSLSATHPATVKSSVTGIKVTVKQGSAPLAGARVCLYMDQVIHDTLATDKQGLADFPIAGLNAGTIKVTVTARDCLPYRGTINVTGQSYLGPTIPSGLAAVEGGDSTGVPGQHAPCTSQHLYDAALLGDVESGLIRTLFLRRDGLSTKSFTAHRFTCDVSLATRGVPGRAAWSTTSYKANRGTNFTRLLSGHTVDFGAEPRPQNPPAPYSVMLPLKTPIQYTKGSNLLVQFDLAGTGSHTWPADAQPYFDYNPGVKYSRGCPAGRPLAGRAPYPDGSQKLFWQWDSGAGYSRPALGLLGTSNRAWGFFIIPLPLSFLGAPGCYLNTNPLHAFGGTTDPSGVSGRYRVELAVPNRPDLAGTTLYAQTLVVKQGCNALDLMASEGLALTLPTLRPALQLATHGVTPPFGDKPRFVAHKGLVLKLGM